MRKKKQNACMLIPTAKQKQVVDLHLISFALFIVYPASFNCQWYLLFFAKLGNTNGYILTGKRNVTKYRCNLFHSKTKNSNCRS